MKKEQAKTRRLQWLAHECRHDLGAEIHVEARRQRNKYKEAIDKAKKDLWEEYLEKVDDTSIWQAGKFASGVWTDGTGARIPDLHLPNGTTAKSNIEKSEALHSTFFPMPAVGAEDDITPTFQYPPAAFAFEELTDNQILRVTAKLKPFKVPGINGVPNAVIKQCVNTLIPYLGPLFRATFQLQHYPDQWKTSATVVLWKPGHPDYKVAKAYRPIALMDTIAKTLSSCISETLLYQAERLQLLPNTHFGGRAGQSTTDTLQYMTSFIKNQWHKGKVVSVLFLDVKAAFPSVSVKHLIHNLQKQGIPQQYTDWIQRKMDGCKTVLKFDDFTSDPFQIINGCDQGCPLSVFCYLFYNADLLDVAQPQKSEMAIAFMDDVNLIKAAKTFKSANQGLQQMMT